MNKSIGAAFAVVTVAIATTLGSGAAQARDIYWSVDIQAPIYPAGRIATSLSNAPRPVYPVYAAPVVVIPQPVYVPQRVVVRERVVYQPVPVVQPYPVYYTPYPHHGHKGKWKHGRHHRHDRDDDDDD